MTRFSKTSNGKIRINGMTHEMLIGSRAQVWHGTAHKTSGGLTKKDLMQNKSGRIVSRAKHSTAKKEMRLVKAGYGTKKGKFGFVKLGHGKSRSGRSRKMRGGTTKPVVPTSPTPITIGKEGPTMGIPGVKLGGKRRGSRSKSLRGGYIGGPYTPATFNSRGGSRRRKRGGYSMGPLSPSYYDGKGVGTSGVDLQFIAGQGN
jgi:hypothetical protein